MKGTETKNDIPYLVVTGTNVSYDRTRERPIRYRCPACKRFTTELWPLPKSESAMINPDEVIDCTCDDCERERMNRIRRHMGVAC